jgi:hypothetical protein
MTFDHFERIADHPPERRIHVRNHASVRTPDATPIATSDCARRRESGSVFMKARCPSSRRARDRRSLRDLLAHDRCTDERDAFDGAGHVAQRVELLVGRRDLCVCRSSRSRPATGAAKLGSDSPVRKPGIASSLSSVPPVWPSRDPTSSGRTRRTPPRAARE